jgi:hypothetical protein
MMQSTQLKAAEVFSIRAGNYWIRCTAGQVWLSHDGHDVILERGQQWQIDNTDLTVIQALQNSQLIVENQAEHEQTSHYGAQAQASYC